MHTWIKICGTTCVEDALKSIEAGADALGFIFAPSKRRVTPEQAQQIIRELPREVERIGVFMNSTAANTPPRISPNSHASFCSLILTFPNLTV